jgi:hypothetical protein
MIDKSFAEHFATEWIAAWNSRSLDRVLAHYTDDFEFASPVIVRVVGEPSGILRGKQAVGAYWSKALAGLPNLVMTLDAAHRGVNSIVIHYHRNDGAIVSEWCEFGTGGKVVRSSAHYAG